MVGRTRASGGATGATLQIVLDCADPDRLVRCWAGVLRCVPSPPPAGFADWDAYYRSLEVPEAELGVGLDRLSDPDGVGLPVRFQLVPEGKSVKNRVHLDITVGGGRRGPLEVRWQRIDAETLH